MISEVSTRKVAFCHILLSPTCWLISEISHLEIYSFGLTFPLNKDLGKSIMILFPERCLYCTCRQVKVRYNHTQRREKTQDPEGKHNFSPWKRKQQGEECQETNTTILERTSLCQMAVIVLETSSQTALSSRGQSFLWQS